MRKGYTDVDILKTSSSLTSYELVNIYKRNLKTTKREKENKKRKRKMKKTIHYSFIENSTEEEFQTMQYKMLTNKVSVNFVHSNK